MPPCTGSTLRICRSRSMRARCFPISACKATCSRRAFLSSRSSSNSRLPLSAKAQITAAQSQVASSEVALNGVREEARVGQRTTLDVLNAQQALVNARVALVAAQHDRVVASYNLLAAVGRLSPQVLGLATSVDDPMVHYQQVRDAWIGIRNPDGR